MSAKRDYYEVLGVAKDADLKTIKTSYRKMALKYHPDRNPGNAEAEEEFKQCAEAYDVLQDESKRAIYDRHGHDGLKSRGFQPGFNGDIGDIFSQFSDIFAEFFGGGGLGGFGGFGGQGRGARPTVGPDLRHDLEITIEQAMLGSNEKIEIARNIACKTCLGSGAKDADMKACAACGGRGQVVQGRGGFMIATTCRACMGRGRIPKTPCTDCEGRGQIEETKSLEVRIPPGVDSGVRLRLQGEGGGGENGGPSGNLYVFLTVQQHDLYVREGANLHCELSVSFHSACFGTETTLPKIGGGDIDVKVPAGMQPGDTVRLQGQGLPRLGQRGTGDIVVHLNINVPKRMDAAQKKAVEALKELLPDESEISSSDTEKHETKRRKKAGSGGFFDRLRNAFEGE